MEKYQRDTWNGIAASVRCVSSFYMLGWTINCDAWKQMRQRETKKTEDSDAFSEVEHTHSIPVLTIVNYICYNDLCKPIEKYICVSENHPFTGCLAAKHLKKTSYVLQTYRKKQWNVLWQETLAPVIIFSLT